MNRIDLIIDALEEYEINLEIRLKLFEKALAAAHELKALKPVGYMDSKGVLFNHTTHPHLNTPLFDLNGEPK